MSAAGPKRNFATLDAIRGIAAICVMGFHYALLDQAIPFRFGNAFIDVDLFFCLSGFVLMQAYGEWAENSRGVWNFFKVRFVRLYPMYLIGTVIGAATFLLSDISEPTMNIARLLVSLMSALLMLPDFSGTIAIPFSITNGLYPLNVPAWSLFFELLANLALCARRWNSASLSIFAGAAGIAFVIVCTSLRTINGGFEASTMIVGLVRVSYSFSVGALLMRLYQRGRLSRFSLPPFIPISIVVIVSAMLPPNGRADTCIILLVLPLTIAMATRDYRNGWYLAICAWLGRISYPLYAVHYPLVLLAMQLKGHFIDSRVIIGLCAIFSIALSELLARTVDPMFRRKLSRAFIGRTESTLDPSSGWSEKVFVVRH